MPKSKNYNNWIKENYPKKCPICDYIANNPAMLSYHKRTHLPIPEDSLCHFGCGNKALFRNTGGKLTCKENYQNCEEYLNQLADRTRKSWVNAEERKEVTKEKFLISCCNNDSVRKKQKQTLKEKWGNFTPEQAKDYRHYARRIRAKAQQWAKDNGYELGPQTFHVDHKLSIFDAWKAGLSEKIVNHPANLRIIPSKENSSKGAKSLITIEELYEKINYEFS
jgi:hypothetical protein